MLVLPVALMKPGSGTPPVAVAPTFTVDPVISGTATEGYTLSATTGTATGTPTPTYTRQWERDGVAISGATASTYVLVTADVGADITCTVTATNTAGSDTATSNSLGPVAAAPAAGDPIVMPLGVRNYGASTVASGSIVQFGIPLDQARGLDLSTLAVTMARDSDSTAIPVQLDLASTTRVGGDLCYVVATAKLPFSVAATTTIDCTVTLTPESTYDGGTETVTLSQFNARDFKIEMTGDDITGTGTVGINSTDAVAYRQIKSGACETGWEGWSRPKVGSTAQGQWGIRWRAMAKGDSALTDWRIEVLGYCTANSGTPFSSTRGRSGTFVLKAGSTTLNNAAAFSGVWVSGFTGFKMYGDGDSRMPAYGGATLRPVHDRDFLVAEKAIWPFRWSADAEGDGNGASGSFADAYVPGSVAGFRTAWGGTGLDGTLGPMSSASYNMLRSLDDDTLWKQGYDAGLKFLSVAYHGIDPATGFQAVQFGSYAALGSPIATYISGMQTTFNSSGVGIMTAETGHCAETAFVPGLLTGEMAFVDGCAAALGMKLATEEHAYYSPQLSGRPRRNLPYKNPGYGLRRYSCWPHRNLAHAQYLTDDDRPDKEHMQALEAETAAFVDDCFIDFLAWTSTGTAGSALTGPLGVAFDGVKSANGTNGWPLALYCWNAVNAAPIFNAGADAPWCNDFESYVDYLVSRRNGETYIEASYNEFFTRAMIGRAMGSGACVSYSATFAPLSSYPGNVLPQTWADYWQNYNDGSGSVATRSSCAATTTPAAMDGGAGVPAGYRNALRLMDMLGWAGEHGETFASTRAALDACVGGGDDDWDFNSGNRQGRWLMAMA